MGFTRGTLAYLGYCQPSTFKWKFTTRNVAISRAQQGPSLVQSLAAPLPQGEEHSPGEDVPVFFESRVSARGFAPDFRVKRRHNRLPNQVFCENQRISFRSGRQKDYLGALFIFRTSENVIGKFLGPGFPGSIAKVDAVGPTCTPHICEASGSECFTFMPEQDAMPDILMRNTRNDNTVLTKARRATCQCRIHPSAKASVAAPFLLSVQRYR